MAPRSELPENTCRDAIYLGARQRLMAGSAEGRCCDDVWTADRHTQQEGTNPRVVAKERCLAANADRLPDIEVGAPVQDRVAQDRVIIEWHVGDDKVRDQIAVPD